MPAIVPSSYILLYISLNAPGLPQNVFPTNCSAAPKTRTRLFSFKCGAHAKHSNKTGFIPIYLESIQTLICSRLQWNLGNSFSCRCEESAFCVLGASDEQAAAMPRSALVSASSRLCLPFERPD